MNGDNVLKDIMPQSILDGMNRFDEIYYKSLESVSPTLIKAVELLKQKEGKRIRPLLLLLVGGSFAPITDRLINGGVFLELFHLSTLIHDDVVDESSLRRGAPSMNAIFGNKKAVLVGDFILATSMAQAMLADDKEVVNQLIMLGRQLSEGEIIQMDTAELGTYSEENYFKIIQRKTSSLIRASMMIGASLSGVADSAVIDRIGEAGEMLGTAFQIRDDIFDYLPTKNMGKPGGHDIREHKITLPLIHALNKGEKDVEKVLKVLRHRELRNHEVKYIIDFTIRQGGIEYAEERMKDLILSAKKIILEVIPEGENREAILEVADYIAHRIV